MAFITEKIGTGRIWYAFYDDASGKRHRKSTGLPVAGNSTMTPAQTKATAQHMADSMEAVAKGNTTYTRAADALRAVAQMHGMGAVMPSVRDFLTAFQGQAGAKTESNRRRAFNAFLEWLGSRADMRLDMLTRPDMEKFFRHSLSLVAVGTVGLFRTNLAAAFNKAVDDELLLRSPMPRLNLAKLAKEVNPELGRDKVKRLPFTSDELRLIVTKFPAPWCDMALVAAMTGGQRLGDVCCLRWDCIDFTAGRLSFSSGKTDKEMDIPLHSLLHDRLQGIYRVQKGKEEYVFPNMARRYLRGDGSMSTEFTSLLKAWGIVKTDTEKAALKGKRKNVSPKSFHSFRHAVVSTLRTDASITADLARAIVGHDSEDVERSYYTASQAEKLRGLDLIANVITTAGATPDYAGRTA